MMQKVYDAAYEADLLNYFDTMLPEKVYDAHFHLSRSYVKRIGYDGTPFDQYAEFMKKYIARDVCGGMVMPQPSSKHTPEQVDDENAYNLAVAAEHGFAAGLIVPPYFGREKTEKWMDTYPQILEVRGRGLLVGMVVEGSAAEIVEECRLGGVLCCTAGAHVVRFLPPLNISEKNLGEALEMIADSFDQLFGE